MSSNVKNWSVGELVTLGRKEKMLKKGDKTYGEIVASRYICVREATEGQRGILVKVLGKIPKEFIMLVDGKPFTKDSMEELFENICYFSYPFPKTNDLKEVLEIIRSNPSLKDRFEKESMHINPSSTYWVQEIVTRFRVKKELQYYDASADRLCKATDNTPHYRLTIVYFEKKGLTW
jgi:hypothetical protein